MRYNVCTLIYTWLLGAYSTADVTPTKHRVTHFCKYSSVLYEPCVITIFVSSAKHSKPLSYFMVLSPTSKILETRCICIIHRYSNYNGIPVYSTSQRSIAVYFSIALLPKPEVWIEFKNSRWSDTCFRIVVFLEDLGTVGKYRPTFSGELSNCTALNDNRKPPRNDPKGLDL